MALRRWLLGFGVVAFAVCVGVLAFKTQFSTSEGVRRASPVPELFFRRTRAVMGKFGPRMRAQCDFWFENHDSEAVELVLDSKSCTCADLQVSLLSPEEERRYKTWVLAAGARQACAAAPGLLSGLSQMSAENNLTRDWMDARLNLASWSKDEAITVPPKYSGIVRFDWDDTKGLIRREHLTADLSVAAAGAEYKIYPRLEALLLVVADLQAPSEDFLPADWIWANQNPKMTVMSANP